MKKRIKQPTLFSAFCKFILALCCLSMIVNGLVNKDSIALCYGLGGLVGLFLLANVDRK